MKKLLNLLSIFTMVEISAVSVTACNSTNTKLTVSEEHNDIVNAINSENKDHKGNNIKLDDISNWNNPQYKNIGNNIFQFTYDIQLNQNTETFLNHKCRITTSVKGQFNINLNTNKISNSNYTLNYLPSTYYDVLNNTSAILTGTTNDFTLIMDRDNWWGFSNALDKNDVNDFLKGIQIYNSNIILDDKYDWHNVELAIANLPDATLTINRGYAACIHIIKNKDGNFQIAYTNLTIQDEHNMPLLKENKGYLPLFSFKSNLDWNDGSLNSKNNRFIGLNKDILNELLDIYSDKTNYHNQYWNVPSIEKLLKDNNFSNTNLDYKTIATCIFNNWNINLVNNFLSKDYNYFILQYDEHNNYIKNNWNM